MLEQIQKDEYKKSRVTYIIEAALEYFISLLVGGAYLAKVTDAIGMSDSLTGILTSFVSLGCGFQLVAIFLANKRPVKRWVSVLHIVNQLFFALIYLVPFVKISKTAKTVCFIVFLLLGHVINNVVNSPKTNWLMGLVDDNKRGQFTASKEIVSLLGGIVFTFIIGRVIDGCEARGDLQSAFIFCGVGIFVLTVLHTVTLLLCKEKPATELEKTSTRRLLKELLKDKDLFKVILVSVLWNIAHYATTPFYGTYQNKELGFSMVFISGLSAAYAICRSLFSRGMGKYADKYSFTKMLNLCFIIVALAFTVNIFTVPENGKVLYTLYYMLYAVAMAGINSGSINLIYDFVDKEKRVGALALKSTIAGLTGFFTTFTVSKLVEYIQANGNSFLGLNVYAQQVISLIGVIGTLITLLYLNLVVKKIQNKKGKEN